ncbi:bacterial transcriptional activator domain-containing protein [Streptacidiphilus sp. MAP12-33]|uniref:bacterial transcriptional activator domain-containing protein n=1 Tax=Streptacidiphilus sp. MAP12-33 TaxID=3156266 RepID=UPI003518D719
MGAWPGAGAAVVDAASGAAPYAAYRGPAVPLAGAGLVPDAAAPEAWLLGLLAAPPGGVVPGEAKLRVLGPVELVGAAGPVEAEWRATLVEVAARRALGPAQGAYAAADAIGRLRAWLGDGPDGRPVNLGCDWEDFQALRARGLGEEGQAGDAALARALSLVRGAPFAEVGYPWADPLRARMTGAVVDVAHELTLRRLRAGDHRGAEAAAHRGLVAEPDAELLLRDLVLLHADAGESPQLQRTVARLETKAARTGIALEPESAALIDELRSPAIDPLSRR